MLFTDVSTDRAVRALIKEGFRVAREGKHIVLRDRQQIVTLPRTKRLNPYTLRSALRSAGIDDDTFKRLLR